MGLIAAGVVGAGLMAGGGIMSGKAADKKRAELEASYDRWLPTMDVNQRDFFNDLSLYSPQAQRISTGLTQYERDKAWNMREQDLPGYRQSMQDSFAAISPLLRGELPQGVMDAFSRAGGASTVGMGMGGSGFGALNTGLFGARGALGGMQAGGSLFQALLGTMPGYQAPTASSFLGQVLSPLQRTQTQLGVRGQNMGIASQLGNMDTGQGIMGEGLTGIGSLLLGGAMGGMGGGAMGGMSGMTDASYSGYGGPQGNWMSPTVSTYGSLPGVERLYDR